MAKKRNEILEQRKKAQRDYIELKKMQSGEIEPEKESYEEFKPHTAEQKVKNFWYHYKVHTIIAVFLAVVIAVCVSQCVNKEKYDARVVLYTANWYTAEQESRLSEYLTRFFEDIDDDGVVKVQVLNCSYNKEGKFDLNIVQAMSQKLQATIISEPAVQIYIVDEKTKEQLSGLSDEIEFFAEVIDAPQDMYDNINGGDLDFPSGMMFGRRNIHGTQLEKTKNIDVFIARSKAAMEKIAEISK